MQYEVIIEVLQKILMVFGAAFVAFISYALYCELKEKINRIMKRQNKIRFLCQHKYKLDWKWFCKDYTEQRYRCTKCGKVLEINVVEEEVE